MIKCNVTAVGTITRSASMRESKEGQSFMSFSMTVCIFNDSGTSFPLELSVSTDADEALLAAFAAGKRISVSGQMTPRKRGDVIYYNLKAASCSFTTAGAEDSVSGDMEFRGTVGKQIRSHQDKHGKPFVTFSAYSSDKVGEDYTFIWNRFILFDDTPGEWFRPGAGFNASGQMELSVYKDRIEMTCRVREISEWEKSFTTSVQ